jgi:squalene synthase HpnC
MRRQTAFSFTIPATKYAPHVEKLQGYRPRPLSICLLSFMPVEHYENFPVASMLLPARLRPAVETIYAFARSADDLADEGTATDAERLDALTAYERALDRIQAGQAVESPLFSALSGVIQNHRLPMAPFYNLLSAFKQDVTTKRYERFEDLLDYCRRSADPVGRLMLALYEDDGEHNLRDSDAICSSLQLINFWQDVAIDWKKERIYIPLEDMRRFGVTERQIDESRTDDAWRSLMRFEVDRARAMMQSGAPLARRLTGRIGWELRLVVQGGLRILDKIEQADYDVFGRRPTLGASDWPLLAWRALRMKKTDGSL